MWTTYICRQCAAGRRNIQYVMNVCQLRHVSSPVCGRPTEYTVCHECMSATLVRRQCPDGRRTATGSWCWWETYAADGRHGRLSPVCRVSSRHSFESAARRCLSVSCATPTSTRMFRSRSPTRSTGKCTFPTERYFTGHTLFLCWLDSTDY